MKIEPFALGDRDRVIDQVRHRSVCAVSVNVSSILGLSVPSAFVSIALLSLRGFIIVD